MSLFAVDGIEPPIPSREITNTAGVDISPEHAWSLFLNTIIVSLLKVLLGQQAGHEQHAISLLLFIPH